MVRIWIETTAAMTESLSPAMRELAVKELTEAAREAIAETSVNTGKRRGRPPGSKNSPQSPTTPTEEPGVDLAALANGEQ